MTKKNMEKLITQGRNGAKWIHNKNLFSFTNWFNMITEQVKPSARKSDAV